MLWTSISGTRGGFTVLDIGRPAAPKFFCLEEYLDVAELDLVVLAVVGLAEAGLVVVAVTGLS